MSDVDPNYLDYQYLYVPWRDDLDTLPFGKAVGLWVAAEHRAPLTVVTPQKSNAQHHSEFTRKAVVTERSGNVVDGGVVLAWCPTEKAMAKTYHLQRSVIVLVEWAKPRFAGWAKLVGAYNVFTRQAESAALTAHGRELLHDIVDGGYNGWHDTISHRLTTSRLHDLDGAGEYDRDVIVSCARQHRAEYGIERLEKILDAYEQRR